MVYTKLLFIFLYFLNVTYCDWVADWMSPVQEHLRQSARRKMDDDVVRMERIEPGSRENRAKVIVPKEKADSIVGLKTKLEDTLNNAEELIEKLQVQMAVLEAKEKKMKDAIANGRSGVSAVTVSTLSHPPRTYLVREGVWSVCNGMVQYPSAVATAPNNNIYEDIFSAPRCIGQEIPSKKDPCAFNSVIKYETIPEKRQLEYIEADFFCLKPAFNRSLEQFFSVPKRIINDTCFGGTVRSLAENVQQCGLRIMSEYTYYPHRPTASVSYPLEYCTEKDGSCKLIVAWHVSNTTVENFEFLKNDDNFKKFFIKPTESYIEHVI